MQSIWRTTSYEQWYEAAHALDRDCGNDQWIEHESDSSFDFVLIEATLQQLQKYIQTRDIKRLMSLLASKCTKNIGGILNERLYSHTFTGETKKIIAEFLIVIQNAIKLISEISDTEISRDRKIKFFRTLEKSYGKTALCLSGGGSQGYYHVGVVKALLQQNLLPQVIAGTSAGALIGSLACTRTDEELLDLFTPDLHLQMTACEEPLWKRFYRFISKGHMFDSDQWLSKTRALIGDYTFEEAYLRTGRVFNVTLTSVNVHSPPILLNYITAPNVLIYSAVVASAAIPGLLNPIELLVKNDIGEIEPHHVINEKWTDGGLKTDLPLQSLAHLFNVNHFIVSQVNPHIIPFFYERRGSAGRPVWRKRGNRGGFITSGLEIFLKYDMKKWLLLMRDLNLFPHFLGHDWSFVFLQNFAGSVTIVPTPNFEDYLHIIMDPNHQRMKKYIERGQANTWPKIAIIAESYKLEKCIDQALKQIGSLDLFEVILQTKDKIGDADPELASRFSKRSFQSCIARRRKTID